MRVAGPILALLPVLAVACTVPVRAQTPPTPERIAELSRQWVDPVTDAPTGTTYHLFETRAR
jgi:hypothetical protein